MGENKKRLSVRWIVSLVLLLVCVSIMPTQAKAASKKKQAILAYKDFLSQSDIPWGENWTVHNVKFALVYVDKDNTPELLLETYGKDAIHMAGFLRLFTYKNGKVVDVATIPDGFAYYKKTGVFESTYTMGGVTKSYVKMSGTKCETKIYTTQYLMTQMKKQYYAAENKTLSKKAFNKRLKKLVKSKRKVTPKLFENTEVNRKKHLK